MTKNKKGQEAPAENRANRFELFDLSEVVMPPVEEETPIPQDEAPALQHSRPKHRFRRVADLLASAEPQHVYVRAALD